MRIDEATLPERPRKLLLQEEERQVTLSVTHKHRSILSEASIVFENWMAIESNFRYSIVIENWVRDVQAGIEKIPKPI